MLASVVDVSSRWPYLDCSTSVPPAEAIFSLCFSWFSFWIEKLSCLSLLTDGVHKVDKTSERCRKVSDCVGTCRKCQKRASVASCCPTWVAPQTDLYNTPLPKVNPIPSLWVVFGFLYFLLYIFIYIIRKNNRNPARKPESPKKGGG